MTQNTLPTLPGRSIQKQVTRVSFQALCNNAVQVHSAPTTRPRVLLTIILSKHTRISSCSRTFRRASCRNTLGSFGHKLQLTPTTVVCFPHLTCLWLLLTDPQFLELHKNPTQDNHLSRWWVRRMGHKLALDHHPQSHPYIHRRFYPCSSEIPRLAMAFISLASNAYLCSSPSVLPLNHSVGDATSAISLQNLGFWHDRLQ